MSEAFVGEIRMFAGNFAPQGWALCNGQELPINENDALFSLFGTFYGGDGKTTFALPDLRGRLPVHTGSGPGLTPRPLAGMGGQETVTLTVNEMPVHKHQAFGQDIPSDSDDPAGRVFSTGSVLTYTSSGGSENMAANALATDGGGGAHNNLMPALCVNFIVCLYGIYPSRT